MNFTEKNFREILDIGIALTTEKSHSRLFELIIEKAMSITACDGGTLYLYKDHFLHFKIMRTTSLGIYKGGRGEQIELPPVALVEGNVCAYSAIHKEVVNIQDVYDSNKFDFAGPKKYDAMTGYRTESMLVIPLENHENELIGVLQLINAQDEAGKVVAFDKEYEQIILSLASQAAVAISNMGYLEEIKEMLYSFVSAFATAVDQRSPYNGNHTRNVTKYVAEFVDYLNQKYSENHYKEYFSNGRKEELVLAASLHDIGKMIVPLSVMDKSTRLGKGMEGICTRYELLRAYYKIDYYEKKITTEEYNQETAYLKEAEMLVKQVNESGFLPEELERQLVCLSQRTYQTEEGETIHYLTPYEQTCLMIKKGTLTHEERHIMESHVEMTNKILSNIHFNSSYRNVIRWASSHHEFLNGSGYPQHLTAEDMPAEIRILSLIDIYDALTSTDRPYKKPMPIDAAISILRSMVEEGKLDEELVSLFGEYLSSKQEISEPR